MPAELVRNTIQQWSNDTGTIADSDRELIVNQAMKALSSAEGVAVLEPGRAAVGRFQLPSGDSIILRRYHRGGLIGPLLRDRFLRPLVRSRPKLRNGVLLTAYRPFDELKVLDFLIDARAAVPTPVAAFVYERPIGFTYRGAIALREIPDVTNLLTAIKEKQVASYQDIASAVGREAWKILNLGVCHTDLHLGNVLIHGNQQLSLIDFDKALVFDVQSGLAKSRNYLMERWARSCKRHNQPNLIKPFNEALLDG